MRPELGYIASAQEQEEREQRRQEIERWRHSDALGGIRLFCADCDREWERGQLACPKCGSHTFQEVVKGARPIEAVREADAPAGNRWKFWEKPKAPELPKPEPADLEALQHFVAAQIEAEMAVPAADAVLKRLLAAGHESVALAQARIAEEIGQQQHGDRVITTREIVEQALMILEEHEHVHD